ncbi:hypothetical protein Leryth_005599 [Lithospermum erythrorhizon]|nr:hypothetical protein Leryth_005599 [Lithospermum erythrorhizon]
MILVAIVAEMLEGYTVMLTRVLQHMFHDAPLPFPRRVRFLILRNLPFASPPLPPPPPIIRGQAAAGRSNSWTHHCKSLHSSDSSFVPPLVYALMGSSRDIAIGPVAVVSLLLGTLLQSEIDPVENPIEYRKLAFTATFFAGVTQATLFGILSGTGRQF